MPSWLKNPPPFCEVSRHKRVCLFVARGPFAGGLPPLLAAGAGARDPQEAVWTELEENLSVRVPRRGKR